MRTGKKASTVGVGGFAARNREWGEASAWKTLQGGVSRMEGGREEPSRQPEVRFSSDGAPLPRMRSQLLSSVVAESPQREPSNSRAAAFPTNQSRPRLTPLTNQSRRCKEVSRAFEEEPLNSNSSAR
ncbi:unnamed protein product [Rangifer tarandus platyrhynchus]|uniref:Uncharacterized protein n=1 Tax=Rangifer tarandus platyrhynchus TaxID=3082113 RepID=A0AC59YYR3_RANTA